MSNPTIMKEENESSNYNKIVNIVIVLAIAGFIIWQYTKWQDKQYNRIRNAVLISCEDSSLRIDCYDFANEVMDIYLDLDSDGTDWGNITQ